MLRAFLNDMFQRLVTFDKLLQRRNLRDEIAVLGLGPGSRVLDFGCGTALFARVFLRRGVKYVGYDIDPGLLRYAGKLHPQAEFYSSKDDVAAAGAYDLIISNCCFHHIDETTLRGELERISSWLKPGGRFLILDLFEEGPGKTALRRLFLHMERGAYFRSPSQYRQAVSQVFSVRSLRFQALPLLPWPVPGNPIASNLIVLHCGKLGLNEAAAGGAGEDLLAERVWNPTAGDAGTNRPASPAGRQ